MPGSNSGSGSKPGSGSKSGSGSGSGSSSSSRSSKSNSGKTTAKNKKGAEKAAKEAAKRRLVERRANAASVRANVTAKYGRGRLGKDTRAKLEDKLKKLRADPALATAELEKAEKALWKKVNRKLAELEEAEAAKKAAEEAEKAAKKEAAKSARTAAATAKREQKERDLAQAKANLKGYLGESPLKKHVEGLYKARQNKATAKMTARNYAKAAGISRTRKLTASQRKLQKKQKSVMADFEAKGVDVDKFCDSAKAYMEFKNYLETTHKETELKHSLPTIIDVCNKPVVKTPESSASASE